MAERDIDIPTEIEVSFDDECLEERLDTALARIPQPVTAAELAAAVGDDPSTVRQLLQPFVELGLVVERAGEPPTYERNRSAFEWSHVEKLAGEHSLAALDARIVVLCEQLETQQRDGTETERPSDIETEDQTDDGRAADHGSDEELDARERSARRARQRQLQRYERARQIRLARNESATADADVEALGH
jgi:DNA-binding transcriptional ArsR family regulator